MNTTTITRWAIGIAATAIWFWGDRAGIPSAAIALSASIVPGLIGHALASPSNADTLRIPIPATQPEPTQGTQS